MRGFGEEGGPVHLVEPPLEVNNGFDEQSSKQVDLLFFACTASAEVLSEGLILDMVPADAHSEAESTSGKQIDVGGLAGPPMLSDLAEGPRRRWPNRFAR